MAIILNITTESGNIISNPLTKTLTIGRSKKCDLTIEDKQLSGTHGTFSFNEKGEILYQDAESTNGSFLDGNRISMIILKLGETLKVGNCTIQIDESKLSGKEKMSIGRASPKAEKLTFELPDPLSSTEKAQEKKLPTSAPASNAPQKKVTVNKALLEKKKKNFNNTYIQNANAKEKQIDQEESSGMTKMLKLNTPKKGGK